jgi:hypothetical protein
MQSVLGVLAVTISNFALTKSRLVLRVSYFQLFPVQITPKFDVFSLTFALRLYWCSVTLGIGKNKPLDVFWMYFYGEIILNSNVTFRLIMGYLLEFVWEIRLARGVCWRKLALGPSAQVFDSSYRLIWSLREIWRILIANSCLFMVI